MKLFQFLMLWFVLVCLQIVNYEQSNQINNLNTRIAVLEGKQ